ncbi:MAG: GtrA family protein [Pseudoxanthomonas sp.]
MSVLRQGRYYLLIGILQWLLDWGVMVGLSHSGMPVEPANVLGRISGALLGFWLNGRITFSGDQHHMGRKQFARFLLMWLATTAASTWAMGGIDDWLGLQWAWIAKPAVELVLGALGFVLSRHWVYKH